MTPSTEGPDLAIETLEINKRTLVVEDEFTLRYRLSNLGTIRYTDTDPTTLRYYQSSDKTINNADIELGREYVQRDMPVSSVSAPRYYTLHTPSSIERGFTRTWYYGICIDSFSGESNDGNNCSRGIPVTVERLVIETPSVSKSVLTAGEEFTLSTRVLNGRYVRFYRSSSPYLSMRDIELGRKYVPGLEPAGYKDVSIIVHAPSEIRDPRGTDYYYVACVESVIGESYASNNCTIGVLVTVRY